MTKTQESSRHGSLTPIRAWRDGLGISATTSWRFRRRKWIVTITIGGRVFVSQDAIADFERRAAAGEFGDSNQRGKMAAATTSPSDESSGCKQVPSGSHKARLVEGNE